MQQKKLSIHSENILPIIKKWLYSDKDIFLRELVSNACDALNKVKILTGEEPGTISIRVDKGAKTITIADTGMGIPSDVLPKIFEPFVTTKGETGTGLGLWVTAEIMKRNGWKVKVRSNHDPGHSGTTFSILIPALRA